MILEGFNVKVKGYLRNSDYEECSLVSLSVVTSCSLEEEYRHFQWIQHNPATNILQFSRLLFLFITSELQQTA